MRWSVRRRLECIEFRVYWEGRVNRHDLMDTFSISAQQASADIARYRAFAPGNIHYDRSAKAYVRSASFDPQLTKPDSAKYLTELRLIREGASSTAVSWIGSPHRPFEMMLPPKRSVDPRRLCDAPDAIQARLSLEVRYQSFSRPEPEWRWIAPHALGFDGIRWHIRALCLRDDRFKDFSPARVLGCRARRAYHR